MRNKLLFLLGIMCLLLLPTMSWAVASSITISETVVTPSVWVLEYSWIGSSVDGSVTSVASHSVNGYVMQVITDPGSPAPTDNYDITLTDSNGADIMGCTAAVASCSDGTLVNRDQSVSEQAIPKVISGVAAYGERYVYGTLTLNVAGNSVTSATGKVRVYMRRATGD